ncbi:structure-specific endonuclease subunit SLX4 [Eupeodes corollae]|uniref:structure-specific endonuclease subunit SLX4 n=1 Tax=Eupeodes corollae TaxID=290404 RepID=UPI0024923C30|nr:structure-specific endonuclease subunit SLX4 [Eupeodes corollae]
MNTRKANFKKLRLPSTETKNDPRNGLNRVATIKSHFFTSDLDKNALQDEEDKEELMECSESMPSPIEYSPPMPSPIEKCDDDGDKLTDSDKARRSTRTILKTFHPKELRMKPVSDTGPRRTNDFETPAQSVKVAPKIKGKTKTNAKPRAKAKPKSKKQQTIKSAFFQNEELFSDVTAQHCLVDNINPEEMQMALALSRSEIEVSGSSGVEANVPDKNDGIREKLKKFGFHVVESEDFNYAAAYKASKGKNKWANKFTPLTLRSSKRQLDKVNQRVEEILRIQFGSHEFESLDEEVPEYSVHNSNLLPFVPSKRIVHSESSERSDTVDFYVLSLFEPSKTKPGYLLKDMRRIPGRDRSPVHTKSSSQCSLNEQAAQLESPVLKKVRVNESSPPVASVLSSPKRDTSTNEKLDFSQQSLPSPISVPGDFKQRRRKTPKSLDLQNTIDSVTSMDYQVEGITNWMEDTVKQTDITPTHATTSSAMNSNMGSDMNSSISLRPIRATSPDIFADSDVEMETDVGSDMERLKFTVSRDGIETYDIFSSDEVKTFSDSKVDSCDKNHNSLLATIDLTQQESETSSQNSIKLLPTSEPPILTHLNANDDLPSTSFGPHFKSLVLTNQDANDDLPSTSFEKQFKSPVLKYQDANDDLPSTSFVMQFKSPKETDLSMENNVLEKSFSTKRNNEFSFGSSTSDDFVKSILLNKSNKSISFNKSNNQEDSIDLTQNDEESIDCIVLSDDEVNYSIRKADISLNLKEEQSSNNTSIKSNSKDNQEFSFVDFVAATQPLATQSEDFELNLSLKPNNSVSSLEMDLSKRSEFGILEEQSPFKTPTKTPKKTPRRTPRSSPKTPNNVTKKIRRALSESFLDSPTESSAPIKRFSSSNKFKEFAKSEEDSFSDLDDIDKLIYGSPTKKVYKKPFGLTQLLTGTINDKVVTPEKTNQEVPQEFEFNGRIYLVRTVDVARRPNFSTMDESALFDKLYRYGIKPLKRKQAEKILEYIYNQTHPCLVDEADLSPSKANSDQNSDLLTQDARGDSLSDDNDDESEVNERVASEGGSSKFNLKDCCGHVLVSNIIPSMEIKDEQYFFPTNKSKKISTAPLPLHIAWYNLLKSNTQLHEAILYYEPIDLQEVYLFLKGIGYRYEPKDMKYFFDSRSIIFRYDVKKSENSASNRHVRKKRQKVKKKN